MALSATALSASPRGRGRDGEAEPGEGTYETSAPSPRPSSVAKGAALVMGLGGITKRLRGFHSIVVPNDRRFRRDACTPG
jgi:hypothetical protein